MKFKFIIILSIVIQTIVISTNSFSQNWAPVKTGITSNFSCDTSNIIFSVWVDSVEFYGNDSVYYLNRVVRPCDTCSIYYIDSIMQYIGLNFSLSNNLFLKNQPQFLQRKINYNTLLSSSWLNDTASYALYPQLNVGSNWVFDTLRSITANLTNKTTGLVLGINDSLVTIIFSTGDSIVLSKNYGIIKFPAVSGSNLYYRLIGIEGIINIGVKVPGFFDIFNYNIGDEFGYKYQAYSPESWLQLDDQYIVIQKDSFPDSLHYIVTGNWNGLGQETNGFTSYYGSFTCNLKYYFDNVFYSGYQIQEEQNHVGFGINFFDNHSFELINIYQGSWDKTFSTTYFNDSLQRISKEINPELLFSPSEYNDTIANKDLLIEYLPGINGKTYHCIVTQGVGYNLINIKDFENEQYKRLTFLVLNGDTILNYLTNISQKDVSILKVYPNPVKQNLIIEGLNNLEYFQLYNYSGELILQERFKNYSTNEPTVINMSGITTGLYIIQIVTKEGTICKKIIKE